MRQTEIKSFLNDYVSGSYDEERLKQFVEWLNTAPAEDVEQVIETYRRIAESRPLSGRPYPEIVAQVEAALDGLGNDSSRVKQIKTHTALRKIRRIWTTAAAAVILAGLFISGYRWLDKGATETTGHASLSSSDEIRAPRSTKAIITLSNGQVVPLDSLQEGVLAVQGMVDIVKTDTAGIVYKKSSASTQPGDDVKYNTLYNPRGSAVVSLVLGDGTKVWLNAESSLHYPVSFSGNERKVEITGEAYFEVAKNAAKQFVVNAGGVITEVLGTHFNVNAYKDEGRTVVTLLEGAVRVDDSGSSVVIRPGQQAVAAQGIRVVKDADLESAMAWKNGVFVMKSADVGSIMRQVARWYNVDIIYHDGIPEGKISGEVSRDLDLSQILQVLKYSGIQVKTDGRRIVVMQ